MRPPALSATAAVALTVLLVSSPAQPAAHFAGMTCTELSAAQQKEVERAHGEACGVLVAKVEPGSLAAATGVQPGDILLSVREPGEEEFYGIPVPLEDMILYGKETTPSRQMKLLILRREGEAWRKLIGQLGTPLDGEGDSPPPDAPEEGAEALANRCEGSFQAEQPDEVLARTPQGAPLTQQDVDLYGGVLAWTFGTRLTEAQRETVRKALAEFWPQAPETFQHDFDQGFRRIRDLLPRLTPEAREQLRAGYAQTFLLMPQSSPDHPLSRVILEVSAGARQVLAGAGTATELTRQDVDALLEYLCFQTLTQTGQAVQVTPADREAFTRQTVAYFETHPDSRPQLAGMDAAWASLRAAWSAAEAARREALARQWQQAYRQAATGYSPYMYDWQNARAGGGEMSDSTFNAVMNAMNAGHEADMHVLGSISDEVQGSMYDGAGNWLYDY